MNQSNCEDLKKTVLITGASRGIGRACARELSRLGWKIMATARSFNDLESLENQLPHCHGKALDLQSEAGRADLKQWLSSIKLDCVVHCIGGKPNIKDGEDPWQAYMDLNFLTIVSINNIVIPLLNKAGGSVVHVSSSAASHGFSNTPYACAKSALNRYIKNEGRKMIQNDIAMIGIMPAAVEGDQNHWEQEKHQNSPKYLDVVQKQAMGRLQTTDEISRAIGWLCGSDSKIFGGCVITTDPYA